MHHSIGRQTRRQLLETLRQRYQQLHKREKTKILDEFVAVSGCHRKHAIRLLTADASTALTAPATARRVYDEAVREALIVLCEAADRICGKRLKAILPGLLAALEHPGHLDLAPTVRERLLSASAATIDRLLTSVRHTATGRKKRKHATKHSKQIPIRTFADGNEPPPGYLEIDFVSHGGSSMQGVFLWSLVATDVCSGWTEVVPLLAREQSLVVEGLEVIRRQWPVPILGIDSDNDGAFINDTLIAYCQEQRFEFPRCRADHKNDQAWIEQKNGAVVRRFVGYDRLCGMVAGQCLAQLFQAVRLYVNHFQPSFKLRSKSRVGAKVKKIYDKPATPCERLLVHDSVAEEVKEQLRGEGGRLDPLELLHRLREGQAALAPWPRVRPAQDQGGKVWNSCWPRSLSCGGRGRPARLIATGIVLPDVTGRAQIPSRACGQTSSFGCKKIPKRPPSRCWNGCTRNIPVGSRMGSYGLCSVAFGSGGG